MYPSETVLAIAPPGGNPQNQLIQPTDWTVWWWRTPQELSRPRFEDYNIGQK